MTPAPERPDTEAGKRLFDVIDAIMAVVHGIATADLPEHIAAQAKTPDDVKREMTKLIVAIEAEATAPVTDAGLDVERLAEAMHVQPRTAMTGELTATCRGFLGHLERHRAEAEAVAAEYAALSRQAEPFYICPLCDHVGEPKDHDAHTAAPVTDAGLDVERLRRAMRLIRDICDMDLDERQAAFGDHNRVIIVTIPAIIADALDERPLESGFERQLFRLFSYTSYSVLSRQAEKETA